MREPERMPTWGDPPPSRVDWSLVRFCLAYVTAFALLVHFGRTMVPFLLLWLACSIVLAPFVGRWLRGPA